MTFVHLPLKQQTKNTANGVQEEVVLYRAGNHGVNEDLILKPKLIAIEVHGHPLLEREMHEIQQLEFITLTFHY